jgi:hypothetical protein
MDLAGRYLVVWLSPEAIETFLGVLEPSQDTAMTTWTVAGQIVGEAGARWARATAARGPDLLPPVGAGHDGPRLYDALPGDVRRIG